MTLKDLKIIMEEKIKEENTFGSFEFYRGRLSAFKFVLALLRD